jgi:hypothetical protein
MLVDRPWTLDHNGWVNIRWGVLVAVSLLLGWGTVAGASSSNPPPVRVRLTLNEHQVVAGQPIKGTVVMTNTTDKKITVNTCATDGWLAVGLSGKVNSHPFGSFLVGCKPTIRLAPGPNRFPVTVITTYTGCTQPQPAGTAVPSPLYPTCTVSNGHTNSPPLPPGRYSTKFHFVGLHGLTQSPNRVVVSLIAPAKPPVLAPCADVPGTALPTVTIPNVVGLSSIVAASSVASVCLNTDYADPVGTHVIAESPVAGSKVPEHSTVVLTTQGTEVTIP